MLVDCVIRTARCTSGSRASANGPSPRCSIADWVRLPPSLWVLETTRSAPSASGFCGSSGWKPKWAPQAASTMSGTPASCATRTKPATSETAPK